MIYDQHRGTLYDCRVGVVRIKQYLSIELISQTTTVQGDGELVRTKYGYGSQQQ